MKLIVFPLLFESKTRIGVKNLDFNREYPKLMKQVQGSRWTPNEKCWHFPKNKKTYAAFLKIFKGVKIEEKEKLDFCYEKSHSKAEGSQKLLSVKQLIILNKIEKQLILNRYSRSTIKTYKSFSYSFCYLQKQRILKSWKKQISWSFYFMG